MRCAGHGKINNNYKNKWSNPSTPTGNTSRPPNQYTETIIINLITTRTSSGGTDRSCSPAIDH